MRKFEVIKVQGYPINVEDDYICLTDMAKSGEDLVRAADKIKNWINNKSTIDFLGTWETLYNPNFKVVEFHHFKEEAGNQQFTLSISSWVDKTDAIGVYSKQGKNGGTYAHKDIAFEFGAAISSTFRLFLIKEFQRLKEIENNANNLDWNVRRFFSKAQYHIQTDAVKKYKIPAQRTPQKLEFVAYAEEADILNYAVFGFAAKQWREANVELAAKGYNVRDFASTNELLVLAGLESINAEMIKENIPLKDRLDKLKASAREQLAVLDKKYPQNTLRKNTEGEFQPYFKNDELGMFPAPPLALENNN